MNNEPSQGKGRLFTIQEAVSKFQRGSEESQETPSENVEDDIIIEDIETLPSSPSSVSIGEMNPEKFTNCENTLSGSQLSMCLPGIGLMIQTLNKYFKNTLMSLLILSHVIPTPLEFNSTIR